MSGLYSLIEQEVNNLEQKIYNKPSLVATSHAIEDVIFEFELEARMFVFFQQAEFLAEELKRYKRLDKICQQLFLFAEHFPSEIKQEFENAKFINLENQDCPLCENLVKEWSLVVDHPKYPMALITKELLDEQNSKQDMFRQFKGSLTFEGELVDFIINCLEEFIKNQSCELEFEEFSESKQSKEYVQSDSKKLLSLFLNNSLNEVENTLNLLGNQNLMLNHALEKNEQKNREILKRLCFAAEYKDEETAEHLIRMGITSTLLYSRFVKDEAELEAMFYGSLMHDIGKMGIPDKILLKPGPLTDEEFKVIETHPEIAVDILRGSEHKLIDMARKIAYTHHEKWNGSGYPSGMKEEQIPLAGRIVAVADVFDALTSKRSYKEAFSLEKSLKIMKEGRNSHFDGSILDVFIANLDAIVRFREEIEAVFDNLDEHEISEYYFDLEPDFSEFTKEKMPSYKDVFSLDIY